MSHDNTEYRVGNMDPIVGPKSDAQDEPDVRSMDEIEVRDILQREEKRQELRESLFKRRNKILASYAPFVEDGLVVTRDLGLNLTHAEINGPNSNLLYGMKRIADVADPIDRWQAVSALLFSEYTSDRGGTYFGVEHPGVVSIVMENLRLLGHDKSKTVQLVNDMIGVLTDSNKLRQVGASLSLPDAMSAIAVEHRPSVINNFWEQYALACYAQSTTDLYLPQLLVDQIKLLGLTERRWGKVEPLLEDPTKVLLVKAISSQLEYWIRENTKLIHSAEDEYMLGMEHVSEMIQEFLNQFENLPSQFRRPLFERAMVYISTGSLVIDSRVGNLRTEQGIPPELPIVQAAIRAVRHVPGIEPSEALDYYTELFRCIGSDPMILTELLDQVSIIPPEHRNDFVEHYYELFTHEYFNSDKRKQLQVIRNVMGRWVNGKNRVLGDGSQDLMYRITGAIFQNESHPRVRVVEDAQG